MPVQEQHELEMIREALRKFNEGLKDQAAELAQAQVAVDEVCTNLDQVLARHSVDEAKLLRFLLRMRGQASRAKFQDREYNARMRGRAEAYEAVMEYLLDGDLSLHRAIIAIAWAGYLEQADREVTVEKGIFDLSHQDIVARAEKLLTQDYGDVMNFWELR